MKGRLKTGCYIGILFLLTGCAGLRNPINLYNAQEYHSAAEQAEQNGDLLLAREYYHRALLNAQWGNAPKAGVSMATYNLGRIRGYLCEYIEAEKLLKEALKLQEEVPIADDPDHGILSMRLFELARFYYDFGHNEQAIPYWERGIPLAEKVDIETSDPIAYANVLDEYAVSLKKTNQPDKADTIKTKADEIRSRNPGKEATFIPRWYNQKCGAVK